MDGPPTYSSPLSALRVSLERLIAFISARRAPAVDEARPRYWSLPLQRAVCAVPLLPTPLDASSLFLSPGAPLSPIFVNLDHVRVFAYSGFLTGFMVGAYSGGRLRRLQFLAENSHRLPRTKAGWYFYLRERNYQVLKRAGQVGARNGLKWAGVVGGFALVETIVDIFRASMTPVEVKGGVEAELQATGLDGSLVPPGLLKFVGPGADPEDFKSTIIAGLATQIAFSKYCWYSA